MRDFSTYEQELKRATFGAYGAVRVTIDFETRSRVDLKKHGPYRYAADPTTEILCVAWKIGDGPTWSAWHDQPEFALPGELAKEPERFEFCAFNAMFERCIWREVYSRMTGAPSPEVWHCTMAAARLRGLPSSLDKVAELLGCSRKKPYGPTLLKLLTVPACTRFAKSKAVLELCGLSEPTELRRDKNGFFAPDQFGLKELMLDYCEQDVEVEREVSLVLGPLPRPEQRVYLLDQKINDRGVRFDLNLIRAAHEIVEQDRERLLARFKQLTGLPDTTPTKFKHLLARWAPRVGSLAADNLDNLAETGVFPDNIREAIQIYKTLRKSSLSKLARVEGSLTEDGRLHGMFAYHQAHTGRWAGRIFQPQNLPRPSGKLDPETLVGLITDGDIALLSAFYDNPTYAVRDAIRNVIVADPGNVLVSCDYSSIEARILATIAGEQWKVAAFREGRDVYIETAERIFPELKGSIDKKHPARQKGKIAELALGYQGWVGAYYRMSGDLGQPEEEVESICRAWREANPNIRMFWRRLEVAATHAVLYGQPQIVEIPNAQPIVYHVIHRYGKTWLVCRLPNEKSLCYFDPKAESVYGELTLSYCRDVHERVQLYGGLLTENVVQALAREVLVEGLFRAEAAGYKVVLHVHDEITAEVPEGSELADAKKLAGIMSQPVPWLPDLPLGAEGWVSRRYLK